jgi:hypothetical protein
MTAAAEVPAVAWAAAVSKGAGGSTALVASLVLGGTCLLPAISTSALHTGMQGCKLGCNSPPAVLGSKLHNSKALAVLAALCAKG